MVAGLWLSFRGANGYMAQPNFAHNLRYWTSLRWLWMTGDGLGLGLPLPVGPNVLGAGALDAMYEGGRAGGARARPRLPP